MNQRVGTFASVLALCVACDAHRFGEGPDPAAEAPPSSDPVPDAGGSVPQDLCTALSSTSSAAALTSVRTFALSRATAIVVATVEGSSMISQQPHAAIRVDEVLFGWDFLAGVRATVPIEPGAIDELSPSSRWIVALSSAHPHHWDSSALPYWGNVLALIPVSERGAYEHVTGYRASTTQVAEVRIVAQDEYRTTFEVIDALKGTFPRRFSDNWYAEWELPYPAVSEARLIVTVDALGYVPAAGISLGSVIDVRPSTPESLELVRAAIASPARLFDKDVLQARRDGYLTSFRFHESPLVVSSLVTGTAEECCTGAGGTYVAHAVTEFLTGDSPRETFVTGGHAYYGGEQCGDAFVSGLDGIVEPAVNAGPTFDCLNGANASSWDAYQDGIVSPVRVRLPSTPENEADIASWIAASDPVYRLRLPGAVPSSEELAQDARNAPWSTPIDAADAFLLSARLILLTVDHVERGALLNRARISTTLYLYEYEHLPRYAFDIVFPCGDARLLSVGSRWVAALVSVDTEAGAGAFLIPGGLIPAHAMSQQLAHEFEYAGR